jgi:hypothetical protein
MASNGMRAGFVALLASAAAAGGGDDTFVFDSGRSRHVIGKDAPDELADEPTVRLARAEVDRMLQEPKAEGSATTTESPPKVWTRDEIDTILRTNDAAVERGIVNLFKLQTAYEQVAARTTNHNNVGFNATNAKAGTRFARWLLGMNDKNEVKYPTKSLNHDKAARLFRQYIGNHGTVMERARAICLLHSQQLTDLANGTLTIPT